MTLRAAANLLFRYGRQLWWDVLLGKSKSTGRIGQNLLLRSVTDARRDTGWLSGWAAEALAARFRGDGATSSSVSPAPFFARKFLAWLVQSPAAELRRNAAKRLMYGGRQVTPYVGFVGINLISGHGIVTKKDELEVICDEIRSILHRQKVQEKTSETEECRNASLDELEIGPVIAQGCSAIVHEARWKDTAETSNVTGEINSLGFPGKFGDFDLAVKMMFNYDAESNAATIYRVMRQEIVPAKCIKIGESLDCEIFDTNFLSAHPNIVDIKCAFVDSVPFLPGALLRYPTALPRRLNADGIGRNMTLFLVMQKYDTNLKEYLKQHVPSSTTRLLILLQLFEGIIHLTRFNVAHRDLKTDNILLDLTEGLDAPRLVITDFGCCLANPSPFLRMSYTSEHIERGGNRALMAPEVSNAIPRIFSEIDYSRSDLWSSGTIAYEIYGMKNPFYGSDERKPFDSRTYCEDDLPATISVMPPAISKLVMRILRRNPKQRPSPAVAANVCHLLLWGPQALLSIGESMHLSTKDLLQWLVMEAAVCMCQGGGGADFSTSNTTLFSCIREMYLSRVRMAEVDEALTYFH